jgi:signal transduction histidine kinase
VRDFVLRRHPIPLLAIHVVASVYLPVVLLAFIPLYGIAAYRPLALATGGGAAVVLSQVASVNLAQIVPTALLAVAVIVTARAVAARRALLAERAASEERLRIARELHDAVGHDVSLMVVQAQALAATSPDAREAATAIAELGRRTMADMHRTLRALRDDASLEPAPTLAALEDVVAGARSAGVPVTLAIEGAPRELAPALDAAAYRIVQEAVTNVVKHAGGAPTAVTVRYGDALELIVADEGGGEPAEGGHGLIGMRERAELFGGSLTVRPGVVVHATLPYAP